MGYMINCLDHGHVRLVSYMQPVPDDSEHAPDRLEGASASPDWTGDLEIVRNARVSYNADAKTGEDSGSDARILKYMWSHGHTSPFEAQTFTFEVKAPIVVFRQWHRHRTQSYNEVSARYTILDEGFYTPSPEVIGKQSLTNKQARDANAELTDEERANLYRGVSLLRDHHIICYDLYKKLLELGFPRELARGPLNVFAYSRMHTTLNLRNLFGFLAERLSSGAQYEIRVYAQAMLELIEPIVPVATKNFKEGLK